jgi:hypothetical protein
VDAEEVVAQEVDVALHHLDGMIEAPEWGQGLRRRAILGADRLYPPGGVQRDARLASVYGQSERGRPRPGPGAANRAAGDILCVQEERRVGNDNTLRWKALSLQLPESRLRPSFVRTQVRVRESPNGSLSVFWGPHRLGDYAPDGSLITQGTALAA